MALSEIESLREHPGQRPPPKARAAIAAAFEADPVAAWAAYVGGAHAWVADVGRASSPWSAPTVESVWAPQAKAMKSFIKALAKQTLALMVRDHAEGWQLGYVVELGTKKGQDYRLELWVGGPPNPAPEVKGEAARGEWTIPDSLASIYAVHDGFGRAGPAWGVEALLPAHGLESLPALIGTRDDGSPMIEEHSLLALFTDAVGDRRGLYRQGGARGLLYKHGFHWDRHSKEVTKAGAVPAVIGRELAKVLRGG